MSTATGMGEKEIPIFTYLLRQIAENGHLL